MTKTVVVGLSGGVDSSVAAYLLKEQGYNVIGLFMKNWEELDENGVCTSEADYKDVEKVAQKIGIPYYTIDFVKEYWDNVFVHFLKEFEMGFTPNPDILCNREIKFKVFFEQAMKMGADFLATGHYCKTLNGQLLRATDTNKDQTYFLYAVKENVLQKVLFPLGDIKKPEVRRIAKELGLATAEKKDSTGICFIGERNFREFLGKYLKENPGKFRTPEGKVVGEHKGSVFYTIGQRKGLGIGGMKESTGESWFVLSKDIEKNIVYVGQGENHPALFAPALTATEISWIGDAPKTIPYSCTAKIRYRQQDHECTITKIEGDRMWVEFKELERAITPRQSIVFYQGEVCLGGAMIERALSTRDHLG